MAVFVRSRCLLIITALFLGQIKAQADPCIELPCKNDATCTSDNASFNCTCLEGFTGQFCQIDMSVVNDTLDRHNTYRQFHSVSPLTHNIDLSVIAQRWADHLKTTGILEKSSFEWRRYNGQFTGENLAMATTFPWLPPLDGGSASGLWYNQVLNYNYDSPGLRADTSHFTQVVWAATRQIGVGRAQMSGGAWVIVAHYFPAGNNGFGASAYQRNVKPYNSQCPPLTLTTGLTPNLFTMTRGESTTYVISLSDATSRRWGVALEHVNGQVTIEHTKKELLYLVSELCFWVRKVISVKVEFYKQDLTTVVSSEQFLGISSAKFKKHCLRTIPEKGLPVQTVRFTITPLSHVPLMYFRYLEVQACTISE